MFSHLLHFLKTIESNGTTVKHELTTTTVQRPPVNNDHHLWSHVETYINSKQRPPVNNGHHFLGPEGGRFSQPVLTVHLISVSGRSFNRQNTKGPLFICRSQYVDICESEKRKRKIPGRI